MQVKIGYTDKKIIEIRQNAFGGGHTLECKLKEPCSMQSPVFIVQGILKSIIYNYCQWEGRFYWIDDIIYLTRDTQEVHCHLDPLATYQAQIKNTYAWVKYADKDHWNKYVDDFRFYPEKMFSTSYDNTKNAFGVDISTTAAINGTWVAVINSYFDSTNNGAQTWAMSGDAFLCMFTDLTDFMGDLISSSWTGTVMEVLEFITNIWGAVGGAGSWADNILSIKWLPIDINDYASRAILQDNCIYVGGVMCGDNHGTYDKTYYKMASSTWVRHNEAITIPWHHDVMTTYGFLKQPRWSSIQIITPGGNFADIDLSSLGHDATQIGWYSNIDICNGNWTAKAVYPNNMNGEVLASFSGCLARDISGITGRGVSQAGIFTSNAMRAASYGMSGFSSITSGSDTHSSSYGTTTMWDDNSKFSAAKMKMSTASDVESSTRTESFSSGVQGSPLPSGIQVASSSGSFGGDITALGLYKDTERDYRGRVILRVTTFAPVDLANYETYCDEYGYPCSKYLKLGDITGYFCCMGAYLPSYNNISPANQSTINSIINTGGYMSNI